MVPSRSILRARNAGRVSDRRVEPLQAGSSATRFIVPIGADVRSRTLASCLVDLTIFAGDGPGGVAGGQDVGLG